QLYQPLSLHDALPISNPGRVPCRVGDLAGDQNTDGFQAQDGFVKHRQTLLALLAQSFDLAVTHTRVDGMQGDQARQLLVQFGARSEEHTSELQSRENL